MSVVTNSTDSAILTCWKDIARHMGKGVRTVQRWEQEFGLPVRRPSGIDHKSSVAAHTDELDAWFETQWSLRSQNRERDHRGVLRNKKGITERIETSRALRAEQDSLVLEMHTALHALIQNCDRLTKLASQMN
jgi:hypothetical protein